MAAQDEEQNPFEILGITPEIIDGMPEYHIREFITRRYQALASLFHPDIDPSNQAKERFAELQQAKETLEIEALFQENLRRHRRKSTRIEPPEAKKEDNLTLFDSRVPHLHRKPKPKTKAQAKVQKEIEAAETAQAITTTSMIWLEAMIRGRQAGEVERQEGPWTVRVRQVSIFDPPPCSLVIAEIMPSLVTHLLRGRSAVDLPHPNYSEIEVRTDGSIVQYKELECVPFRGRVPAAATLGIGRKPQLLSLVPPPAEYFYLRRRGGVPPVPLTDRLIGSVVLEEVIQDSNRPSPIKPEHWWRLLFPRQVQHEEYDLVAKGYPWERMLPLLPYMSPFIEQSAPLVAVNLRGDGPRFRILGQVKEVILKRKEDRS